jgi:predicted nucleotidyltransferase
LKDEILKELSHLELERDIKILYAVESGSRAWGFASTDSDWDVRFIYVHRLNWYLQIDDRKDTIDRIMPNKIDLGGWDLRKALILFRKSNPPFLEWLHSPLVYVDKFSSADNLRKLVSTHFSSKSCIHHYLNMASGNYKDFLDKENVITKKYFYVLRPLLACEWLRNTNTPAPMEFETLLNTQVKDYSVISEINKLLLIKKSGGELGTGPKNIVIDEYLRDRIYFYKDFVNSMERSPLPKSEILNKLFVSTLNEVWVNDADIRNLQE